MRKMMSTLVPSSCTLDPRLFSWLFVEWFTFTLYRDFRLFISLGTRTRGTSLK